MLRHKKIRVIPAVIFAAMLSVISAAVMGTSPSPELVKLAPAMVGVDTSTLPPAEAQTELAAVWGLVDNDTETAYTPSQTARVFVSLPGQKTISRLRVYGNASYVLNVSWDDNGTWKPVPSLTGKDLTALGSSWNALVPDAPFTATQVLLEFVPQGNITSGIRELELWGNEQSGTVESAAYLTLGGLKTPREALAILAKDPGHILEYSATPSELTVPDSALVQTAAQASISLARSPVLFKRAYILYDGYNLVRSVSIRKRINGKSWSGGFVIPRPESTTPSWSSYLEEINPAWLVQGENKFEFRSMSGTAYVRGLKLVLETDSGWNAVSSVSQAALYDGDVATPYKVRASSADTPIDVTFERPVQPQSIRLHLKGPLNLKAGLQYATSAGWQDVKTGWQLDLAALQPGWNEIPVPAAVTTSGLRLLLSTSSLRLKPGVEAGEINELRVSASPAGSLAGVPRIIISYPRDGEYFGRTAYVQGFALPSANALITLEDKTSTNPDGAISLSLTKDETRFSVQVDDDPWAPILTSTYGGQAGTTLDLLLNKNSGSTTTPTPGTEGRGNGPFGDNREKHTEHVAAGQAKKIEYNGVILDIPQGAVDKDTDITIVPLNEADLAHYNPGMINVTYPAAGYRLLPHGMKFKKAIKISFGYSKQLLAAGQTDNDVNMYYYDESLLRWQSLTRLTVDAALSQVTSQSDHFTDIINSTLVTPEHPQALSFNPNSIKDIKAADPSANIDLIEPPKANSKGTANLSYPIEVPPGRNRLQPGLAVQYNSSGGNGWMGLGWDIPMQAITIDTRWGVPRYDTANETETYTIDGEQLSPVAHRGPLVARTAEKVFHTRVEGRFRKIVRHGNAPANYWWEVIDKNGTKYFYGGGPDIGGPTADSTLMDGSGRVFKWALRKMQDTNGNTMKYNYSLVHDSGVGNGTGGVDGYQLYLKAVRYTGHGATDGAYTVLFTRDRELGEARRSDVAINARGGFKEVTADLLRKIEMYFGGAFNGSAVTGGKLIRKYEFRYNENPYRDNRTGTAFNKTLLTSAIQYGKDGATVFDRHDFGYYDEARAMGGSYLGFASSAGWNIPGDGISAGLLNRGVASALGGNKSKSGGGHFYIGLGHVGNVYKKDDTAGLKIGSSQSESDALLAMVDIDGDGLPDKVFQGTDGSFYYRKNLSGPHGSTVFGDQRIPLAGIPGISHENVTTTTVGGEIYGPVLPLAMADMNHAVTKADTYFADVNGDGLIDVVSNGRVYFNHLELHNGVLTPTFTLNSADTPVSISAGTLDTNGILEDPSAVEAERADKFPLLDTLRRWKAPYDGTITINAPVQLIQDTSTTRANYKNADGVRVAIQLEGGELWSNTIAADDYTVHTPTGTTSIPVHRGDRIYFRAQSVFNGAYDQVAWDPVITYNGVPSVIDVNNLDPYGFQASKDFTLAGRHGTVSAPLTGTLHLAGTLRKNGATTDDITLSITKNNAEVFRRTVGFADTTTINISQDISVTQLDVLQWSILVDSPIDASQVTFSPTAWYTAADGVDGVTDDQGNYVLVVNPPYGMDIYSATTQTVAPQASWTAVKTGTLATAPTLSFDNGVTTPTQVVFTVKKRNALLGKGFIGISRDMDGNLVISYPTFTVPVTKDDQIFFDFSARDTGLASHLLSNSVQVNYVTTPPVINYIDVPSAFHSAAADDAFPEPYRGWGAIGYNGNSPRDTQPVDQSLLVLNGSFDPNNARVYPFVPLPDKNLWGGVDDSAWVTAGQASSSRLGLKDISMPHSGDFAGASAPPRISESNNVGVSLLGFVGSSSGSSKSKLEFQDLNGDGFPDVIGNSGIQYTSATGGLTSSTNPATGLGTPRSSDNVSYNIDSSGGGNLAKAIANARGDNAPTGNRAAPTSSPEPDMPKLGFTGGYGTSDTAYDLIDVNGDGLPDKVYKDGTVQLNLGYAFAAKEPWGGGIVNNGQSVNGGLNLGFNLGNYSWAGGLGLGIDESRSDETYVDINGDGLPDKVIAGDPLTVRLNTGSGFTAPISWPGGFGKVAVDKHISLGGGVYFTYGFNIPVPPPGFRIVFNFGINFSASLGRPELAFRDMDGKGYVDQVHSESDGQLQVAQNQIGRTNLLKTVKRPLGGSITLKYQREGNTYDMPQSQWTMTKTTLTDGRGSSYVTSYAYANGHKDRLEREFYGFATVTETHAPGTGIQRTITETFNNSDFYLKGLLLKSVTTDKTGRVWAKSANTYTLTPVSGFDFTEFPALTRTDTYFYDGTTDEAGFKKSTYQTFAYDESSGQFGNVTTFFDAGEVFTSADDVNATIAYYTDLTHYIIKPQEIKVYGAGGPTALRWRESVYDPTTGNMTKLTLHNTGATNSVWNMTYDSFGNIATITDPVSYKLTYGYDNDTNTYVTRMQDNFPGGSGGPYFSTASYNPLFGQVATSVDLNMNVEARGYDQFGRLACVYGPYDLAPTDPDTCAGNPTITFTYTAPVINSELDTPNSGLIISPAHAVTNNRAVSVKGGDPIIIKTVTYVDGMKRIIQTKKDADVNGAYGTTVSGIVVFDDLGRVTQQAQPIFEAGFNTAFTPQPILRNPTIFNYDPLDRTTMVVAPDGATTTTSYAFGTVGNTGNLYAMTTVVDPEGNKVNGANRRGTKVSFKDVHDRIMAVTEYNNGLPIITNYAYDPLGQITTVVDAKNNTTTVEYDLLGRRTAITNPDTGKTSYGYDANGNLTSKLTAKNNNISYNYVFNRLTDITYPQSPTVHYDYGAMNEAYNRAGRIKKVTDESGTEQRFYGKLGETTREQRTVLAHTPSQQQKTYTTDYVFDSFGRMQEMTYPDGELLHYAYDDGGLLKAAWGVKAGNRYNYINSLLYDEFGQRTHIEYGNSTTSNYTYDPLTRRLATLVTTLNAAQGSRQVQNLSYQYDLVGNVKVLQNGILVATNTALPAGPVRQEFGYDDLYQLTSAKGAYGFGPGKENNYHNQFSYDAIGNMTIKNQVNQIIQPSTTVTLPKETNYVLNYVYGSSHPHAVTDAGDKLYSYDASGNMTGWTSKTSGQKRTIIWNEENRVKEIDDNGKATYFLYDDAGERVTKRGQYGETIYINRFYSVKNGELGTKNVFAGETRVLSKLVKTPNSVTSNSTGTVPGSNGLNNGVGKKLGIIKRLTDTTTSSGVNPPVEKDEFFYHGDHLGSSNMITDSYGAVYQHLEYFPYGETWIEEGGSHGGNLPGYKFTGKELDPETGLYYFGARYYDAVLSKWISADPIIAKYFDGKINGGVYNPRQLGLYSYSLNNPVVLLDPDGRWSSESRFLGYFQPVHQQAIQIVLGSSVTPQQYRFMAGAQEAIDRIQGNESQYMHAMTGAGQNRADAIKQANEFVKGTIEQAQKYMKSDNVEQAYSSVGLAIHTVQDATSPSHRGFQTWDEHASNAHKLGHVEAERAYPAAGTLERTLLEGGTQWVYDVFTGKAPMPQNFFDPKTGQLSLPSQYGGVTPSTPNIRPDIYSAPTTP